MLIKKIKKQNIIILGSKSFIGKEIIKKLNNKHLILIHRKKIDLEKKNSIFKLRKLYKKNDILVFIAAIAPVKNIEMLNRNLIICENVLKSLENIKLKHLVYISSDAVYSDNKLKLNEASITIPNSLHGFMHLIRENMLQSINCSKTIIRPTLVYGENDPHNGYGPNKFIRNAQTKKEISLFGKGEEKRDHINVEDVAKIVKASISTKYNGIVNAVSGKAISFDKIANQLKILYPHINIKYVPRKGPMPHNGYRAFNNSKLKSIFPKIELTNLSSWIKKKIRYN